jgi:ABC-2 type transport system permease protein
MMLFYSLLAPMIIKTVMGLQMLDINQDIYTGGLNKYIIYPVSYFQFKLTQQLTQTVARLFQMIITIVLFKWFVGFPKEFHFVMANGVLFVVNIFISSVLFFIMEAIMEIAAFWAENVWSLSVLLRFLISFFSGAWLSLSLFPKWSLPVMNYLPFRTLVYVPIKILFGEISFGSWFEAQLVSIIWIIFFVLIYAFLWGKGRIHYTGVGI